MEAKVFQSAPKINLILFSCGFSGTEQKIDVQLIGLIEKFKVIGNSSPNLGNCESGEAGPGQNSESDRRTSRARKKQLDLMHETQ